MIKQQYCERSLGAIKNDSIIAYGLLPFYISCLATSHKIKTKSVTFIITCIRSIWGIKKVSNRLERENNGESTNDKAIGEHSKKRKTTKKGIIITALIVTGIIGASFIVYFIP